MQDNGTDFASGGGQDRTAASGSQGILYMRKWKITILKPSYKTNDAGQKERDPDHDVEMDVSLLRCLFKTSYVMNTAAQIGTLVVYNMNAATEKATIEEGFQIRVEGGYEQGQYGEIFTGDILQIIRNREDGIDYRLEILAMRGIGAFDINHTRSTIAANSEPRDIINTVCKNADEKIPVGEISENLSQRPLPRGKVLFGTPGKYLRDIALANNACFGLNEEGKAVMECANDEIPEDHVLYLTPMTGLVGTPKYTDNGIQIKMLLEPRIKIRGLVKIDNDIIQRQLISVGSDGKSSTGQDQKLQFDKNGEYKVISYSHSMDTFGDEWVTEVIGLSQNGKAALATQMTSPSQHYM